MSRIGPETPLPEVIDRLWAERDALEDKLADLTEITNDIAVERDALREELDGWRKEAHRLSDQSDALREELEAAQRAQRDADVLVQSVLLEGSDARRDKTIGALQHRIEELQAEVERLRSALERVAALDGGYPDDYCAIARTALEPLPERSE